MVSPLDQATNNYKSETQANQQLDDQLNNRMSGGKNKKKYSRKNKHDGPEDVR